MTIRKTIQWMFVIVLLAAVGGAAFLYWFWTRSDELLRQQVEAQIAERAPHWRVKIDRARFDWVRKVHLYDVSIGAESSPEAAIRIQEIVITVDPDALATGENIVLQRIQLFGPTIDFTRHADGTWSTNDLLPLPEAQGLTPEWEINQLQGVLRFEHVDGRPPTEIGIDEGHLQLVPSGKRQYLTKGKLNIDGLGKIQLDGEADLTAGSWRIDAAIEGVPLSRDLVAVAEGISDQVRIQRTRLEEKLNRLVPQMTAEGSVFEQRAVIDSAVRSASAGPLNASGLLNVNLQVKRWKPEGDLDYRVRVDVQQGNVAHAALPFPLQDVRGTLYCDNRQFIARNLLARNAATQLLLKRVEWKRGDVDHPLRIEFDVSDLPLDERLKERVPAAWHRLFEMLKPSGQIDVEGVLVNDRHGRWRPQDLVLTAKNGAVSYEKFPYRVTEITGTLTQKNDPTIYPDDPTELEVNLLGRAGRQPVTARGTLTNPGPELQMALDIALDNLAINDTFVAACPRGVQKGLDDARLRGTAKNVLCRLFRPAGPKQPIVWDVNGEVIDGSVEYRLFPYRLSNLAGKVAFQSRDGIWRFNGAEGVHGLTRVTATSGEFGMPNSRIGTDLKLVLDVKNLELDTDLEQALPPRILKVWKDVSPRGRATDAEVDVHWSPETPLEINIPKVRIVDGSLLLRAFPYGFENVKGAARYGRHPSDPTKDLIEITELSARHDDTQVRARGYVEFARQEGPTAEWRVRLEDLRVDDLMPDRPFRRALPEALRSMTDVLNPQGKVSLAGMIDFRGTLRGIDPITAGWDLTAVLSQGSLTTGVDLKNVNGSVRAGGTWDGEKAAMRGLINLDSVEVWGHQLTEVQGPFELNDRNLIVGSRQMFPVNPGATPPTDIPMNEHIRAKGFGATFTLDAAATLNETTDYHVKVDMRNGSLRQYALRYMAGTSNLSGSMDGWVDMIGSGPNPANIQGKGQLQIRDAALYELPVMVQILKAFSFTAPTDNSAFKYALTTFTIANGQFDFNEIDMVGDAFSLRGRGAAKFDGQLALDFYSEPPKSKFSIPIFQEVVIDPLTRGWMGVKVTGTVQSPRADVVAVPQLDAALKQFLGAFPRPGAAPPPMMLPWRALPRATSVPQLRSQQDRTPR